MGEGKIRAVNADTVLAQAGFYTSQQAIQAPNRVYEIYMSLI
jgi:hypothetical protein